MSQPAAPLALRCPHCAEDLDAREGFVAFGCPGCHALYEPGPSGLTRLQAPLLLGANEWPTSGEVVLLPVWSLPIRADEFTVAAPPMPPCIHLPALGLERPPLLLQFARNLSRAPLALEAVDLGPLPCAGLEFGLADAYAIAELVVLGAHEGWPPDELVDEVEIPFGSATLGLLPLVRERDTLRTLGGELAAPAQLVGDRGLPNALPVLASRGRSELLR